MPDEQPNSQAPWWDQTIMKIGSTFGVPTLLLGYFLAQNAGVVPNPVETELENIRAEMQELKGAVVAGTSSMKEIVKVMDEQRQQRQMRCVVKAKTEQEKLACFPAKKIED